MVERHFRRCSLGVDQFSFIGYGENLCEGLDTPAPLAHLFSLARDRNCRFLVEEAIDPATVEESVYELDILAQHHKPSLKLSRKIYRICFFSFNGDDVSIPYVARYDSTVDLATEEDKSWFLANASSFDCVGYLFLFVDFDDKGPVSAYVPESVISTKACFGAQKPTSLQAYIHCAQDYSLFVLEKCFTIHGSYFAQQEGWVWCCGHAAVRTSLRLLDDRNVEHLTIAEMNAAVGIDHVNRIASCGLTLSDVRDIFRAAGISSEVMHRSGGDFSAEKVLMAAYHSVELGLPAVLSFEGHLGSHMMAVVGHTFDPSLWISKADRMYFTQQSKGYLPSFEWVDKFVVQDDNLGPYHTLLKRDLMESVRGVVCPTHILYAPTGEHDEPFDSTPNMIEHLVYSFLCKGGSKNIIKTLKTSGLDPENCWLKRLITAVESKRCVLRPTVVSTSAYLEKLERMKAVEVLQALNEALAQLGHIILVEISIPELYQWNHRRLGEAVIGFSPNEVGLQKPSVLFMRLPGVGMFFGDKSATVPLAAPEARYHCEIFK